MLTEHYEASMSLCTAHGNRSLVVAMQACKQTMVNQRKLFVKMMCQTYNVADRSVMMEIDCDDTGMIWVMCVALHCS